MTGNAGIIWAATPQPEAMRDGNCVGTDPETFFVHGNTSTGPAKAICRECPAKIACLTWALDNGVNYGVWGGADEADRAALRRRKVLPIRDCAHCGTQFRSRNTAAKYCGPACVGAHHKAAAEARHAARLRGLAVAA